MNLLRLFEMYKYSFLLIFIISCISTNTNDHKREKHLFEDYYLFQIPEWNIQLQLYNDITYHKTERAKKLKSKYKDITATEYHRMILENELHPIQDYDFELKEFIFSSNPISKDIATDEGWTAGEISKFNFERVKTHPHTSNEEKGKANTTTIKVHKGNWGAPSLFINMDVDSEVTLLSDTINYHEEIYKHHDFDFCFYKAQVVSEKHMMYLTYDIAIDTVDCLSEIPKHRERFKKIINSVQEYKYVPTKQL